ncbi:MAG: RNA pseudouridine synthase [Treponema sp.]|nr:RNA pseudouridine synthase [Treponema sp.]
MDYFRPLGKIPYIVDETESYAVVYKPPLIFSAPLGRVFEVTLLGWYARHCPKVLDLAGNKKEEGGLLHRLDFETEGLVLFAKTQGAYESLRSQQEAGDFVKEYLAISCPPSREGGGLLPGFPPPPVTGPSLAGSPGACIESFFRPWGPGRRAVRPVTAPGKRLKIAGDRGKPYRTEILSCKDLGAVSGIPGGEGPRVFGLRIRRGFRHQIRCHLAWIGEPVLCDTLYGGQGGPPAPANGWEKRPIGLRAWAFRFFDPGTGEQKDYRLPSF